jgi:hypothetical protein
MSNVQAVCFFLESMSFINVFMLEPFICGKQPLSSL